MLNQAFLRMFQGSFRQGDFCEILRTIRRKATPENYSIMTFQALKSFEMQKKRFHGVDGTNWEKPMSITLPGLTSIKEGDNALKIPR